MVVAKVVVWRGCGCSVGSGDDVDCCADCGW